MTPDRRAELRTVARAYAFDVAFGGAPLVGAMARTWGHAESREESRRVLADFNTAFRHFARRAGRAAIRSTLREVRRER